MIYRFPAARETNTVIGQRLFSLSPFERHSISFMPFSCLLDEIECPES